MSQIKPNAAFIGHPDIAKVFSTKFDKWNFVALRPTIEDFRDGLDREEFTDNIQVVVLADHLFDPKNQGGSPGEFETFIHGFAPFCFFVILEYNPNYKPQIMERLDRISGDSETDVYFIPKKGYHEKMLSNVEKYISTHENAVADILAGREPRELDEVTQEHKREVEEINERIKNAEAKYEPSEYMGRVVCCTSPKGGSGKSSVAILLATYLAHSSIQSVREGWESKPLKVCVLDLDIYDGQIGFITSATKPTILKLLTGGINVETLKQTAIFNERLKIDVILAPRKPQSALEIQPGFYQEVIALLRTQYDFVILDTSVNYLDPLLNQVAYPMSDLIICVTDIVIQSVMSMSRWIQNVTYPVEKGGMGISRRKIGIVINKAARDVNMSVNHIQRAAQGVRILPSIPSAAQLMAAAANTQAMDMALKSEHIRSPLHKIARAVVGPKYRLAESFPIGVS